MEKKLSITFLREFRLVEDFELLRSIKQPKKMVETFKRSKKMSERIFLLRLGGLA